MRSFHISTAEFTVFLTSISSHIACSLVLPCEPRHTNQAPADKTLQENPPGRSPRATPGPRARPKRAKICICICNVSISLSRSLSLSLSMYIYIYIYSVCITNISYMYIYIYIHTYLQLLDRGDHLLLLLLALLGDAGALIILYVI